MNIDFCYYLRCVIWVASGTSSMVNDEIIMRIIIPSS
jgi:hypothetical protein